MPRASVVMTAADRCSWCQRMPSTGPRYVVPHHLSVNVCFLYMCVLVCLLVCACVLFVCVHLCAARTCVCVCVRACVRVCQNEKKSARRMASTPSENRKRNEKKSTEKEEAYFVSRVTVILTREKERDYLLNLHMSQSTCFGT